MAQLLFLDNICLYFTFILKKMRYHTYWSVLDLPSKSIRSYDIFLFIIIFSLVGWFLIKKFKNSDGNIEKSILLWFTAILFTFSLTGFIYLKIYDKDISYENTRKLLESSQVAKVEGKITNFQSYSIASRRGVTQESFTVDSIKFSYSDELLSQFNQFGKTNNGLLKNGLPVRITYGKDRHEILKIEIAYPTLKK